MKKIAITGAAGFIGVNLAEYLTARGYSVFGSDVGMRKGIESSCTFMQVDILDGAALKTWLNDIRPEVVFHLGARTDLLGNTLADYSVNIQGVENLIAAIRGVGSVQRVVFASSRMVCRIDYQPQSYEDYCPPNTYGESKKVGEEIVKGSNLDIEWTMVRPTSIWGPGFGIPYRNFFDQVRKRRYFHPKGFRPKKSFGYIGNTIFQLESLINAPADLIDQRCFYLGDYEPLILNDWAELIHQQFQLPDEIMTVPMPLLRMAGLVGDGINCLMKKEKFPLTSFRLNNLITDMVYPQLEDLRPVTGSLPFSWVEGTRKTVEWMINN